MNLPRIVMGCIVGAGVALGAVGAAAPAFGKEPGPAGGPKAPAAQAQDKGSPLAGSATERWHAKRFREEGKARRGARTWGQESEAQYRRLMLRLREQEATAPRGMYAPGHVR